MKSKPKLDKFAIAAALQEIAALLELKGGKDRFKARAYQTGARVIAGGADCAGHWRQRAADRREVPFRLPTTAIPSKTSASDTLLFRTSLSSDWTR